MRFTVERENIYNALNAVSKATAQRGIQPVLSNVLIDTIGGDKIKLSATDLDLYIEADITAEIKEAGSITLPAKKLTEIITRLPEKSIDFTLNTENNLMKIICGKTKFDLIGISASEFPKTVVPESDESIEIKISELLKAVKETSYSSATYDTSNVLSGVYFEVGKNYLEMAATDGNRLSRTTKKLENTTGKEYTIVVPTRTLVEFTRILTGTQDETVKVVIKNSQISFKLEERILVSRLLEGQYPKYKQLIPTSCEKTVLANRELLTQALERTSTMVNERTSIVKFLFENLHLYLSADTPDLGDSSDVIEVEYEGDELNIAFNYKYILDAIKVIDTERVKIELNGSLSPAILKPDSEEDYLCLVMPVQIR